MKEHGKTNFYSFKNAIHSESSYSMNKKYTHIHTYALCEFSTYNKREKKGEGELHDYHLATKSFQ